MATGTIHSTLPDGASSMLKKVRFTATEYTINKTSGAGSPMYYYTVTADNFGLVAPEGYKVIGVGRFGSGNGQVAVSFFTPTTATGVLATGSAVVMGCKWYLNAETSSVTMPNIAPSVDILFAKEDFVE